MVLACSRRQLSYKAFRLRNDSSRMGARTSGRGRYERVNCTQSRDISFFVMSRNRMAYVECSLRPTRRLNRSRYLGLLKCKGAPLHS